MADSPPTTPDTDDQWSKWFMKSQVADDSKYRSAVLAQLQPIRERVLSAARLKPRMTVLDVGTGYGFVAFGAIERVGPTLNVIATDVSEPLLKQAQAAAEQRGVGSQIQFVRTDAETLNGIADESVDVVIARAVLAFVPEKAAAIRNCYRVLRPGGRLSIAEPICQDESFEVAALARLIAEQPNLPDIPYLRLLHRCRSRQYPGTADEINANPLTNFSERDLFRFAREAGFAPIHVEAHLDMFRSPVTDWNLFIDLVPHPRTSSMRTIMNEVFTPAERSYFERVLRPRVESGRSMTSEMTAFLSADKPL